MTWTVTHEDAKEALDKGVTIGSSPNTLHVRAIIDIDNEQDEIKELIASLQKHVKDDG